MSDKLLNQDIDPEKGVKRLNAKPLYIVIVIGLIAFFILIFSIFSKQKKDIKTAEEADDQEEVKADLDVAERIVTDGPIRNYNRPTNTTTRGGNRVPLSPDGSDPSLNGNESELVKSLMLRIQDLEGEGKTTGGLRERIPTEEELAVANSSMRISFSSKGSESSKNGNDNNTQSSRIAVNDTDQAQIKEENDDLRKEIERSRRRELGIDENGNPVLPVNPFTDSDPILGESREEGAAMAAYESRGEDGSVILPFKVQDPVTHLELKAGSIINATLINGINTDLEGTTIAQISSNIYDSHSGQHLLIPQGAKLLGEYGSSQSFGDTRVGVTWNRLIFPNGKSLTLGSMAGGDTQGYSGLRDKVNNHYLKIYGGALALSGVTTAVATAGNANNVAVGNQNVTQTAQQEVALNLGRLMTQQLQQSLNIEPTIIIRPGKRVALIVTQDLTFEEEHTDHLHFNGAYQPNSQNAYFDPSMGVTARKPYKEYSK